MEITINELENSEIDEDGETIEIENVLDKKNIKVDKGVLPTKKKAAQK